MIGHITCAKCAARLKYDDQRLGKIQTCPCPKCGATVHLPAHSPEAKATSAAASPPSPPAYAPAAKPIAPVTQPVSTANAVAMQPPPAKKSSAAAVWIVAAVVGVMGAGTLFSIVVCAGVALLMSTSSAKHNTAVELRKSESKSSDYSAPYGSSTAPSLTATPAYIPPVTYDPSAASLPAADAASTAAPPLPLPWRTSNTPITTPAPHVETAPAYAPQTPWFFGEQEPEEDHWDREVRRLGELGQEMRDRQNAP